MPLRTIFLKYTSELMLKMLIGERRKDDDKNRG